MARPCGCGSGGVVVRCGTGLSCTGVGTSGDPLVIAWQIPLGSTACNAVMDCVGANLGAGMEYFPAAHRIGIKVSGDDGNVVGFGSDGGLLVTGLPDPGSAGVTLNSLPDNNLVCSSLGAGYAVMPDGYRTSYELAMADEHIHMIHVPVRRSKDLMLYAVNDRNTGWYTNDAYGNPPVPTRYTDQVESQWSTQLIVRPSGVATPSPTPSTSDNPYNTLWGYFGFGNPVQQGLLRVEEVFRITARRKCLYLTCNDVGGAADTQIPAFTIYHLIDLVESWGLQKSVIISGQLGTGDQDVASMKLGLQTAASKGIAIGVHITNAAEATANPPQSLVDLGVTWVGLSIGISNITAVAQSYIAAGLQVLMFVLDRQTHWTVTQNIGARGAICSDPMYVSGHTYGFRYRYVNPPAGSLGPFSGQNADPGRYGYSGTLTGVHARLRGWVDRSAGSAGVLKIATDAKPPTNSGFHMPMGPWNPIFDRALASPPPQGNYGSPNNYDIEFGVAVVATSGWQPGGQQGMGAFFCVPKDVRLFDLAAANTETIGYSLVVNSQGTFTFRRYDGTMGTWVFSTNWASGWGSLTANRVYRITIQVRPDSIRCGPSTENGGINGTNARQFTGNNPAGVGADLYRGPYVYASFWEAAGFDGFRQFHDFKVVNYS